MKTSSVIHRKRFRYGQMEAWIGSFFKLQGKNFLLIKHFIFNWLCDGSNLFNH